MTDEVDEGTRMIVTTEAVVVVLVVIVTVTAMAATGTSVVAATVVTDMEETGTVLTATVVVIVMVVTGGTPAETATMTDMLSQLQRHLGIDMLIRFAQPRQKIAMEALATLTVLMIVMLAARQFAGRDHAMSKKNSFPVIHSKCQCHYINSLDSSLYRRVHSMPQIQ